MDKKYIVRAYLLSQHVTPFVKMNMETKDLAVSLAEVLLSDRFHYVTVCNLMDDEIMEFKKELVITASV